MHARLNVCLGNVQTPVCFPPETMALILCLIRFQDALISLLRRSQLHFIHCLVPTTVESKAGQRAPSPSQPSGDQGVANEPPALDIPALRVQLAGSHILEALRLHRAGRRHLGIEHLVLMAPTMGQTAIGQEHSFYAKQPQNRNTHYVP